eukprot:757909-Hanusia_phi.AAC.2
MTHYHPSGPQRLSYHLPLPPPCGHVSGGPALFVAHFCTPALLLTSQRHTGIEYPTLDPSSLLTRRYHRYSCPPTIDVPQISYISLPPTT